jgi:hypothetical protein
VSALATTAAEYVALAKSAASSMIDYARERVTKNAERGEVNLHVIDPAYDGGGNMIAGGSLPKGAAIMVAALTVQNVASEDALVRALLASAVTIENPDVEPIGVYVARLGNSTWNTTHPDTARERLIDAVLETPECDECSHALDVHDENGCTHEHDASDGINAVAVRCACDVKRAAEGR